MNKFVWTPDFHFKKEIIMELVRRGLFLVLLTIVSLLLIVFLFSNIFPTIDFHDVTHTWKAEPIVSVYIPPDYLNSNCEVDYEPVFAYNTVKGISKGPCGCAENLLGTLSSSASCDASQAHNSACMSLNSLPQVHTLAWRGSVICVKRDGQPAASKHHAYNARPRVDGKGRCPDGYKKCGEGQNQQEGAICFPHEAECPITNLLILPRSETPSVDAKWGRAGVFPTGHTLFFRREFVNELPITAIAFRLTELSTKGAGHNKRGMCYEGFKNFVEIEDNFEIFNQVVNSTLAGDPAKLWSYDVALPPVCEISDPRYTLVDQVLLQDHFLQNLQLTVPTCKSFSLYPLSDPRYQPALDPDYLNSGVKCGSTPHSKCVRDPYQPTDCPAGDEICDAVVNQNVCGEYAHAVRSAFSDYKCKGVTLGMYFAREVQWADWCSAYRENLLDTRGIWNTMFAWKFLLVNLWYYYNGLIEGSHYHGVRFMTDCFGFPLTIAVFYRLLLVIGQMSDVYDAVSSGDCTDSFTRDTIQDRVEPFKTTHNYVVVCIEILAFLTIEGMIMYGVKSYKHHLVRAEGGWHFEPDDNTTNVYRAVATDDDAVAQEAEAEVIMSMYSATEAVSAVPSLIPTAPYYEYTSRVDGDVEMAGLSGTFPTCL